MQIVKEGSSWIARCSYSDKDIVKAAGFRWNPDRKVWYTQKAEIAAKLMDPEGAAKIQAEVETRKVERAEAVEASRAADADVVLPCPDGLAYLPYQRAGIAAALRRPNVLFGDEMGLGKTIEAIGVINADETLKKVLVICPASLRLNWQRELKRWLCREMSIQIVLGAICRPELTDVTIINYDNLSKHAAKLRGVAWDCLIIDEAHYLKNPDAKRTQAVCGREKKGKVEQDPIKARRVLALTGTPIPNRPIEGWTILHYLDSKEFYSFFGYAKRYAAAHQNGYGWDFSGSANLPELQEKLRASIMIRRLKADVLTELPAKRRQVIEIPANGASGAVESEKAAFAAHEDRIAELRAAVELAKASDNAEDYADAVAALKQAAQASFTELSQLRHDTAVAKIPYVIAHVQDVIEGGSKVIVFAHHHDVIEALAKEFGEAAVVVYGQTAMLQRQANVDRFQTDPECSVFIGGILAAGVGLTLTASSHVIFAELDWVPGNVTQAEDRAHRIGQKNMVLVQHLVLEGSLDARMATILVEKQEVIAEALDTKVAEMLVPVAAKEHGATESTSRKKVDEEAGKMTPERIAAVHEALQIIARYCDGARQLDGAGFSKIDVRIGHSLADTFELTARQAVLGVKLVNKYKRQVPAELVAMAAGKVVS